MIARNTTIKLVEITANILLFLSGLLLLVDYSPQDLLPQHRRRKRAIDSLRKNRNLIKRLDPKINIGGSSSCMQIVEDDFSCHVLIDLIRQRAPEASEIEWRRSIGVGYAVQSLPVGGVGLPAFKPLYIVLIPAEDSESLELYPVGQLSDLYTWLARHRTDSTTRLALALLVTGFFLQLVSSLI